MSLPGSTAGRRAQPRSLGRRYAFLAGILSLVSLVAGGFGEAYVPSKLIVAGNAAATAHNIVASQALFRLGFAAYLTEAMCDIGLALLFYLLLKPVSRDLALLAVFFRLVGTGLFAVAEMFYFAPAFLLGGGNSLDSFSPEQLNTLALLSLKMYGYGAALFIAFYGLASILFGYLIFRSTYLPKFLGVLLALGGAGFVLSNFVFVLAPAYASSALFLPMVLAALALTVWLLARGVDAARWEERAAAANPS